jgi:TonB family protein
MPTVEAGMHPAVAQSLLIGKPLRIRGFLLASLGAHIALFGAIAAASYLQFGPTINLNQQPLKASLVRLGKPRDPKLLPRILEAPPEVEKKTAPEPPKPAEPPPPAPAATADTRAVAPSRKAPPEQSNADRRKQLFSAFNRTSKPAGSRTAATIEDMEGQLDGDPNGDSATQEGERYFGQLKAQVQRNYDVSQTIPEQERLHLKAQVIVLIGRTGEVLKVQLARRSGNELFDSSVLAAVKKASPFSPPPEHLRDALQRRGIALEFRP